MRRARFQRPLLVLAGVTAIHACHSGNSILLVEVSGDLSLMPQQLAVTVTAGGRTKAPLLIPPVPTPISLPTSFTIELDGSITGPVTIAIDALDGNGSVMASGTTTQTHINIGGQTLIPVTIGSGSGGPPGGTSGSAGNGSAGTGGGGGFGGSNGGTGGGRSGFGGFNRGTGG